MKITRLLFLILVSIAIVVTSYSVWRNPFVHAYFKYFFQANDVIQLDFKTLKPMSMEEVKSVYPIKWKCVDQADAFGDSYCTSPLKKWNDVPAVEVTFWFENNLLINAKVDVPSWHEKALQKHFDAHYGKPNKYNQVVNLQKLLWAIVGGYGEKLINPEDITVKTLGQWELDSGEWIIADPERNRPFYEWHTVFWMSSDTVSKHKKQFNIKD